MTRPEPTPQAAVLVAVGIAKLCNEVLIELPDTRRRWRLAVANTRAEHDRPVAELQALARPIPLGFEPTGQYRLPLAWHLVQAGFDVRPVSSAASTRSVSPSPSGSNPKSRRPRHIKTRMSIEPDKRRPGIPGARWRGLACNDGAAEFHGRAEDLFDAGWLVRSSFV